MKTDAESQNQSHKVRQYAVKTAIVKKETTIESGNEMYKMLKF